MTINDPASGHTPDLPAETGIPTHIIEKMMLDAFILHGLIEALDILSGDGTPAVNSIITVARPLAKKLADDLSLQW